MNVPASPVAVLTSALKVINQQCDESEGPVLDRLILARQAIESELQGLEQDMLQKANYIPKTDAFKAETDEGKSF